MTFKMLRKGALVALLLLVSVSGFGQKFLWDVNFKSGFDNREYKNLETAQSATLFGLQFEPAVGLGWGEGHSIFAGGYLMAHYGARNPRYTVLPEIFYQYDGEHFRANAGIFPKRKAKGDYPKVFLGDNRYYGVPFQGALLAGKGETWMAEAILDWVGRIDKTSPSTRERFMVYTYATKSFGPFYVSFAGLLYHYASSEEVKGVVDNIWIYPYVGLDFTKWIPLQKMDLRAGWLNTFQNNRITGEGYQNPGGFQMELDIKKWGVGVDNTLYLGGNLHPLYYEVDAAGAMYGEILYLGDPYYSTDKGIYNRLELYFEPKIGNFMKLRVSSVHHYDGSGWGWQQFVKLIIDLNNISIF
ncbi:MAG: hypothetical protein IIY14_02710 [Bacteroidales bacterium]|nr:hypothetical protein [Bacteroidales bacterium]MBQ1280014.1 hypothetical protein [Bacteroidales bacterium]